MQLNILIVGVLFPAILVVMINFCNRYQLLARLIRNLHDTVINEKILTDDSALFSSDRQPSPETAADRHYSNLQFACLYFKPDSDDFALFWHQ